MPFPVSRDLLGGAALILIGAFFAIYAGFNYRLGSFAQMGPGMLPFLLGLILVGLGLIIGAIGIIERTEIAPPDWRALAAVTLAIVAFAVLSELFGMVPAVVAVVAGSALADNKLSLPRVAALTAVLTVVAVGLFHYGLGIRMPIFAWPF